jgi:hypothetical protein
MVLWFKSLRLQRLRHEIPDNHFARVAYFERFCSLVAFGGHFDETTDSGLFSEKEGFRSGKGLATSVDHF